MEYTENLKNIIDKPILDTTVEDINSLNRKEFKQWRKIKSGRLKFVECCEYCGCKSISISIKNLHPLFYILKYIFFIICSTPILFIFDFIFLLILYPFIKTNSIITISSIMVFFFSIFLFLKFNNRVFPSLSCAKCYKKSRDLKIQMKKFDNLLYSSKKQKLIIKFSLNEQKKKIKLFFTKIYIELISILNTYYKKYKILYWFSNFLFLIFFIVILILIIHDNNIYNFLISTN